MFRLLQIAMSVAIVSGGDVQAQGVKTSDATKPEDRREPNTWRADDRQTGGLGPETTIQGYGIRPPKGYQSVPPKGKSEGLDIFVWAGPKREGKLGTTLIVDIFTMDETFRLPEHREAKERYVKAYNAKAYVAYRKSGEKVFRWQDFKDTPPENGFIGDIPFSRLRWNAKSDLAKSELKGFYYMGEVDNKIITLLSFDSDDDVLQAREAAVLTFRKLQ